MQCLVSKPIFKMLVSKYHKQKELGPINWFASEMLDFDIRNHTQKNFEKKTWKDKEKTNLTIYKNEMLYSSIENTIRIKKSNLVNL